MRRDEALDRQLLPNEKILWSGRPARGFIGVGFQQGFRVVMTTIVCAVILTILIRMWAAKGGTLPLPLVIAAVVIAVTFLRAVVRHATSVYAVTDRRVLIVRRGPWLDVRSLPLDSLPEVALRESFGGRGTIVFGQHSLGPREEGDPAAPSFIGIADARHVFRLIQEQATARPAR